MYFLESLGAKTLAMLAKGDLEGLGCLHKKRVVACEK
jgi:hypothetical protein